jgi:hypothetical protein
MELNWLLRASQGAVRRYLCPCLYFGSANRHFAYLQLQSTGSSSRKTTAWCSSSWIEENLLGSTGFVGRISYTARGTAAPRPQPAIRNAAPKRDSEFYKNILQLLVAGANEMSVIKSLLTGDQHGHTLALGT